MRLRWAPVEAMAGGHPEGHPLVLGHAASSRRVSDTNASPVTSRNNGASIP